jgi:outer membrane protein OmpA-like peptidoglycan-associated protein
VPGSGPHHHRGPGEILGGIGGLVIGAIFADELARHDWEHAYEDAEWCEEHQRWEPLEEDEYDEEVAEDEYRDEYEDEAATEDEYDEEALPSGIVAVPPDVLFDPGSTAISKGAQSRLQRLADSVRERTDLEVLLRGHSDVSASEKDAFAISEKRAQEVRSFLAEEGVPWRRMRIVGLGAARPVATNESASGRQRNRRVEIVVREVGSG